MSVIDDAKLYLRVGGKMIPFEDMKLAEPEHYYRMLTVKRLKVLLQKNIDKEDYEEASIINKIIGEKVK